MRKLIRLLLAMLLIFSSLSAAPNDLNLSQVKPGGVGNDSKQIPMQNAITNGSLPSLKEGFGLGLTDSPSFSALNIIGTAGAGFINFAAQSSQPSAPAAGVSLLHASTQLGFTRLEMDNESPTTLHIGRDNRFLASNSTGSTIVKGALVHIADGSGPANDIPTIVLADNGDTNKFPVAGIVQDDILDGASGYVLVIGIIKGVDGHGFTPGFPLYLDPSSPGSITDVRPIIPDKAQVIGYVLDGGNPTGAFFIHIGPFVDGLGTGTTAETWNGNTVNANGELQTSGNRVGYNLAAYGTGTTYTLTNTAAAVALGTTSPSITIDKAGTYMISGRVQLSYSAATVVAETATLKLRRTNNTAADLTSGSTVIDLPVSTTLTNTYGVVNLPPVIYTTSNTNDIVTIFANVSATLGAGTIKAEAGGTNIVAIRLY